MDIVTKKYKLNETGSLPEQLKELIREIVKDSKLDIDKIEYVQKGLEVYKQPDFNDGEKSVITYITTGHLDRDYEIVKPDGGDFTTYLKHPVVLFGHDYKSMPVGRCSWIKADGLNKGLIAKTIYANTPQADLIYNYRKDLFPLAVSIGFIPTSYVSANDITKKDEFASEIKNAIQKGWITEKNAGEVRNIIQKWTMLEYSDCSVPANSQALQIAVNKGIISKEEFDFEMKTIVQVDELKSADDIKILEKVEVVNKGTSNIIVHLVENKTQLQDSIDDKTEYIVELDGDVCKTVIPFSASTTNTGAWDGGVAEGRVAKYASSDGSGNKDKINWIKYGSAFAYKDGTGDKIGDFHLPHHDVVGGTFVVVWRGVAAAMAALNGARGASIPIADKAGIFSHLSKHYAQFKKTPPKKEFEDIIVKTNEPPVFDKVSIKILDNKSNPSMKDIMDSIMSAMNDKMQLMRSGNMNTGQPMVSGKQDTTNQTTETVPVPDYFYIQDMYPTNYPDGHCVMCCCTGSDYSYMDYSYTFDPITEDCTLGDGVEMDMMYNPAKSYSEKKNYEIVNEVKKDINYEWIKLENNKISILKDCFGKQYIIEPAPQINEYKETRETLAINSFPNFKSIEPLAREQWEKIYTDWIEYFLTSMPGKETVLEFCKAKNLSYKGISDVEDDSIDEMDFIEMKPTPEETANEIRIRVRDPKDFEKNSFKYKVIKADKPKIAAIFAKLKGESTMTLQSYRFPKSDGWTLESAKAWVNKQGKKEFKFEEEFDIKQAAEILKQILDEEKKNTLDLMENFAKRLGRVQI